MTPYASHLANILESKLETSPRGLPTKELIGTTFRWDLARPLILDPIRKLNYTHSFGEAAWIVSGDNSLGGIKRYLRKWADFSDDGFTLNGAYGPPFREQLAYIVKTLNADRFSRQAVMTIWRPRPTPSKDIPCTVAIQFLIREGKLHVVVSMRSSDAWWGLPYDISTFAFMAYAVAMHLNNPPELGEGVLNIGSAHIYENFFHAATDLVLENNNPRADYALNTRRFHHAQIEDRLDYFIQALRELAEDAKRPMAAADTCAIVQEHLGWHV